MSDLIKYDISSYGDGSVLAECKGNEIIYCADIEKWCRASDVDSYIGKIRKEKYYMEREIAELRKEILISERSEDHSLSGLEFGGNL